MTSPFLQIRPLGGLGEIGMNCLALSQAGTTVAIDCGALFPHDDYGIERWIPPVKHLLQGHFAGLVLTHGHEDHIGAVAELAAAVRSAGAGPLHIWGPDYAMGLVELRLAESSLRSRDVRLQPVLTRQPFEVGPFGIEAVRMTHSIADATALCIETVAGAIFHSGDFKLDPTPVIGEPSDEERLRELGDRGIRLLLSDSTNALRSGHSASEQEVADALETLIGQQPARVVVGIFSSNVHRLSALGRVAQATGRKLCLLGRSMRKHATLATKLGYLDWPSDLVLSPFAAKQQRPDQVLYLATGTQGEERGALNRLAHGQVKDVSLEPHDSILISSRIIPGCESSVYAMYNRFLRRELTLITQQSHPQLHASGHGYEQEQRSLLRWLRPMSFVPLHGTTMHLQRHAAIAREEGVSDIHVMHNGDCLRLRGDAVERIPGVPVPRVAVGAEQALEPEVLQQRRQLGQTGVVAVALSLAKAPGEQVRWTMKIDGVALPDEVRAVIDRTLASADPKERTAWASDAGCTKLERTLKRAIARALGERPTVWVLTTP